MEDRTSKNIRVALVDDHPVVREGIRSGLEGVPHIEVVGEAANGEGALEVVRQLRPDVLLLDITMPGMDGLAVLNIVREESPGTKILILSMHDKREYVTAFLKAGASGYVLKESPSEELARAIETVYRGDAYFSPGVSRILLQEYAVSDAKASKRQKYNLSPREREVLILVARGLSNKEIAGELFLSVRTVETHRENLMRKLGIHSAAGLTRFAIAHGFVEADPH